MILCRSLLVILTPETSHLAGAIGRRTLKIWLGLLILQLADKTSRENYLLHTARPRIICRFQIPNYGHSMCNGHMPLNHEAEARKRIAYRVSAKSTPPQPSTSTIQRKQHPHSTPCASIHIGYHTKIMSNFSESATGNALSNPDDELSPLEQDVLDEYERLAENMKKVRTFPPYHIYHCQYCKFCR
jgi:hypothetical protein